MIESNRNKYWIDYWEQRSEKAGINIKSPSKKEDYKFIHGRGSFPDDVYDSIAIDIVKYLDIKQKDLVADIGGASGDQSKYIIEHCNPKYLCLFDASINSVRLFQDWINKNNLNNVESKLCVLPELKTDTIFTKIIVGSVFQYLNSIIDLEDSIKLIYNSLEKNGKALFFHHYDKDNSYEEDWDLLLISFSELESISKKIGFKKIERVKVGLYHGDNACGKVELSVLLTK